MLCRSLLVPFARLHFLHVLVVLFYYYEYCQVITINYQVIIITLHSISSLYSQVAVLLVCLPKFLLEIYLPLVNKVSDERMNSSCLLIP